MADFNILPTGLKTGTQLPLDVKSRSVSELILSNLGIDDQLAFTYEEGLIVRCIAEGTNYIWRSVQTSEPITGLLTSNFTYPQGIVVGNVSYSGRAFNFFKLDYVTQTQFAQKVDKVTGERLINASEITKLSSLQNVQLVNPDWNATSGFAKILNKPVIIDAANYATKTYVDAADNLRVLKQTNYSLTKNDLTDSLKSDYDAAVQWIINNGSNVSNSNYNLNLHISNSQNPHFVTKSQVGLGLADDTSDLEKPVSLDTQSALDLKADLINGIIPASQLPAVSNTGILKQSLATGLSSGGLLEINTNASRFNSNAGSGYIVNGALDVDNPTATKVTWDTQTGIVVPNISSTKTTYVARDINGALFFSANPLTATQRRNYIRLGVLVHLNNTTIEYIDNQPTINIELGGQVHDILDVLGFRSLSGNRIFPASTNLKIRKEQGRVFKPGANFNILATQPHSFILPLQDPVTFRYRTQTGNEGADVTDINPAIYDVNGTFTGMPSTATLASIQRMYIFQDGVIRIQPGQRFFTNLSEAILAINSDVFVTDDDISNNGLYLGAIVLTRNSTNLSNIIQAIFVPSQGTTTNGSVPSSAPLGYTPEDVANKQNTLAPDGTGSKYPTVDATRLALTFKADLVSGFVPSSQLPSYVDDVLEFSLTSSFPTTGELGKIYIAVNPKNEQYRWSGSSYIQITNGLIASTNDLVEGASNLYFLESRVLSTVLSGLVTSTNSIITSTDSSLVAFGKLQSQINQKSNNVDVVKLAGSQQISGIKTFRTNSPSGLILDIDQNAGNAGMTINQRSGGGATFGIKATNFNVGDVISVMNYSSGSSFVSDQSPSATGNNYVGKSNGITTFTISKEGSATFASSVTTTKLSIVNLVGTTQPLLELGETGYIASNFGSILESNANTGKFSLFNYNNSVKDTESVLSWSRVDRSISFGGTATFASSITASNLSGSNTGDQTLASLNAAPANGSDNYIQNQNVDDQAANMRIDGSGTFGGNVDVYSNLKIKTDNNPATSLNTFILGHSFNSYITQNITHDGTNLRYDKTNTGAIINFAGSNIAFSTVASGTAGTIPVLNSAVLIGATQTVLYNSVKLPNLSGTGTRTVVVDPGGVLSTITTPSAASYKVYTVLLSQNGTANPVIVSFNNLPLENTLGGTIVWSYGSQGSYYGTLTNAFTAGKTFILTNSNTGNNSKINILRASVNQIRIDSFVGVSPSNDVLGTVSIEIRVYN